MSIFAYRTGFKTITNLPIATLLSFIPMYFMRITSNVMSLGGIAVAVVIENGESGSKAAAPIALAMIEAYLKPTSMKPAT